MAIDYKAYNRIQYLFFTDRIGFNSLSDYEINQFSFLLFNAITKVFPSSAKKYMFYNDFMKFDTCPNLIRALQTKFVSSWARNRIPQAVYFKSPKTTKKKQTKKIANNKTNLIEFGDDIQMEIKSRLFIDTKTYESIKYTNKIQSLGQRLINEYELKLKQLIIKN